MTSPQVVIVDETFASTFFPNEDPIGKRIRPGISTQDPPPWREIVGVVAKTKLRGMGEDFQPQFYIPYAQLPGPRPPFVVRTKIDPLNVASAVRTLTGSIDKDIPMYDVRTMDELFSASMARERFNTLLFSLFAALALTLAAVGIYGVVAYSVSQTTHEIGIRMALGAQPTDVLRVIVRGGLKHVAIGLGIGLVAALALTRLISSMLYGVHPTDPLTLAAASMLLTGVALLAMYIPARRATRVDPMVALRYE